MSRAGREPGALHEVSKITSIFETELTNTIVGMQAEKQSERAFRKCREVAPVMAVMAVMV